MCANFTKTQQRVLSTGMVVFTVVLFVYMLVIMSEEPA